MTLAGGCHNVGASDLGQSAATLTVAGSRLFKTNLLRKKCLLNNLTQCWLAVKASSVRLNRSAGTIGVGQLFSGRAGGVLLKRDANSSAGDYYDEGNPRLTRIECRLPAYILLHMEVSDSLLTQMATGCMSIDCR